ASPPQCERSEKSEISPGSAATMPGPAADPFIRWRLTNAERLTVDDLASGHDPGGFCAEHRRWLSYPEQKRGACSWCVPVDPAREPEYWASHWRRFTERRRAAPRTGPAGHAARSSATFTRVCSVQPCRSSRWTGGAW